ncbi:MAG: spore cortex biosynthesis protein YabQ [Paenisporosarcina sp.]
MTLSYQFLSLLAMIASGVATGFLVESFRDIALAAKPNFWVRRYRFFLEIILWAFLGCASYVLLFYLRDGAWRIYDPMAQIVGIGCYELWLRKPLLIVRRIFMHLIVRPIWWIIHLFISIIRYVIRVFVKIILIFIMPIIKIIKKIYPNTLQK